MHSEILESSYYSRSLNRVQPFGYVLPEYAASSPNEACSVIVLLHGKGCDYRSWAMHTRAIEYLSRYRLVAVLANGDEGWYTNSFDGAWKYEDDIILDLIPEIRRSTPAAAPGRRWAVVGMSMGGYGALKLALTHSHAFGSAVSHGGAVHAPRKPGFSPVFGDSERDSLFRSHASLEWLAEQCLCRPPVERPHLFIDCGLQDPLLEANRQFAGHLTLLGYTHEYNEAPGHHTWPYWNRAFRTVLPALARCIGAAPAGDEAEKE